MTVKISIQTTDQETMLGSLSPKDVDREWELGEVQAYVICTTVVIFSLPVAQTIPR